MLNHHLTLLFSRSQVIFEEEKRLMHDYLKSHLNGVRVNYIVPEN